MRLFGLFLWSAKIPQHSTDSSRLRTSSLQTWLHESYCAPGSPVLALLLVLGSSLTSPRAAAHGRPHLSYSWVLLCLPPLPPLHTKAPTTHLLFIARSTVGARQDLRVSSTWSAHHNTVYTHRHQPLEMCTQSHTYRISTDRHLPSQYMHKAQG